MKDTKMTTNPSAHSEYKASKNDAIKNRRCELKDDYDHQTVEIEYVIENVLFERQPDHYHQQSSFDTVDVEYQNLSDAFNSILMNSCSCTSSATPTTMTTMAPTVNVPPSTEPAQSRAVCGTYTTCPHGGNYISSPSRTELVLNPQRPSKDLIYECSVSCKCNPDSCDNRLVQFGPRLNLQIIASKVLHKQYALRTNVPIPRGAFVCEYAGEILTRTEAQRRMKDHEQQLTLGRPSNEEEDNGGGIGNVSEPKDCNKMNYVLCLNEYSLGGETENASSGTSSLLQTFVDPRLRGNIGRYLNHSCQPNCEILSVRVDCPIPRVAIFAKRDIDAGEELCFHYGDGAAGVGVGIRVRDAPPGRSNANAVQVNKSIPCRCGSDNCERFLPNLEF